MRFQKQHGYCSHGKVHPIWESWRAMRRRCFNRTDPAFKNYGGRGITVCERWLSFKNFAADMAPGWRKGLTIERVDNDGAYCPENCIWTTMKAQQNNRRNNIRLSFQGLRLTIAQWSDRLKIHHGTLLKRLRVHHWTVGRALQTPVRRVRPHVTS